MSFDRDIYFDAVRGSLFNGSMTDQQVLGQDIILYCWEQYVDDGTDLRWLAYELATTKHETASTMWPIEEYGKGEGHPYGEVDPETGQGYWGRGFVQTTWRENYRKADEELGLSGSRSCEWHADNQLLPDIAARTMHYGMVQGWFRSDDYGPQTLGRYFSTHTNDPYGAREIINGDKHIIPDWSNGVSIGNLVSDYWDKFLRALHASWVDDPVPEPAPLRPEPEPEPDRLGLDDIVETIKGAKFWGKVIAMDNDEANPGCTVLAIHPEFAGTKHVYPLAQLRKRS